MSQHQIKATTRNQAQGDETVSRQEQLGRDQEDDNLRNIVGVSNCALGLLYGHGILTIYENLLL